MRRFKHNIDGNVRGDVYAHMIHIFANAVHTAFFFLQTYVFVICIYQRYSFPSKSSSVWPVAPSQLAESLFGVRP